MYSLYKSSSSPSNWKVLKSGNCDSQCQGCSAGANTPHKYPAGPTKTLSLSLSLFYSPFLLPGEATGNLQHGATDIPFVSRDLLGLLSTTNIFKISKVSKKPCHVESLLDSHLDVGWCGALNVMMHYFWSRSGNQFFDFHSAQCQSATEVAPRKTQQHHQDSKNALWKCSMPQCPDGVHVETIGQSRHDWTILKRQGMATSPTSLENS